MKAAVVVIAGVLTGCATSRPQPVIEIVERRVEVPESLLSCMPEPKATEVWRTQRDVALYLVKLAEAGEDCRAKLAAVQGCIVQQ